MVNGRYEVILHLLYPVQIITITITWLPFEVIFAIGVAGIINITELNYFPIFAAIPITYILPKVHVLYKHT